MTDVIINTENRLANGEHSFISDNTTSDFVIRLPFAVSKFQLIDISFPLTYYVINDYYNKIIFRVQKPPNPREYYLCTIPEGTYTEGQIANVLQTAMNNAVPLANPAEPALGGFTITMDTVAKRILVEATTAIEFITVASPTAPFGIPYGDPDGFPSELIVGAPVDPIRAQLNNCAKLLGLPLSTVYPDPTISTDGFPIGTQFNFVVVGGHPLFNVYDLSGENYILIKTDVVGQTPIREAREVSYDINSNDFQSILNAVTDIGIIGKLLVSQVQYSKITAVMYDQPVINLQSAITDINFKINFVNNIPVDLNGINWNFTIKVW